MMTTDVLKLPGNYRISAANGGTITLDVGGTSTNGTVVINGNLDVLGVQSVINSTNVTINDNILILNSGDHQYTGTGVTLGTSGIMVSRGHNDSPDYGAFFLYDDTITYDYWGNTGIGAWTFGATDMGGPNANVGGYAKVGGIIGPVGMSTFTFFGSYNPNAVLSVHGTTNYMDKVTDPDHIPNKAYVDSLLGLTEFANVLKVGNSTVKLYDPAVSTSSVYYRTIPQLKISLGTETNLVLTLQGTNAKFSGMTLAGNQIQLNTGTTATSLVLQPGGSKTVQIQSALQLQQTTAPASTASFTGLYSTSTVGGGGTGLFYVNTNNTDELVSRRRSIVYSIIF